jgi:hypothetical protein
MRSVVAAVTGRASGLASGLRPGPPWGAHIVSLRRGYTHHGIYVGNERVVQYGGLTRGLRRGPVEEVLLSVTADDQVGREVALYSKLHRAWLCSRRSGFQLRGSCAITLQNHGTHCSPRPAYIGRTRCHSAEATRLRSSGLQPRISRLAFDGNSCVFAGCHNCGLRFGTAPDRVQTRVESSSYDPDP